jgi:hypothetical protein
MKEDCAPLCVAVAVVVDCIGRGKYGRSGVERAGDIIGTQ